MIEEGKKDKSDMRAQWILGSYKVWVWSRGKGKWGTGESTEKLFKNAILLYYILHVDGNDKDEL